MPESREALEHMHTQYNGRCHRDKEPTERAPDGQS